VTHPQCPICHGTGTITRLLDERDDPGVGSYRITRDDFCPACVGISVDSERELEQTCAEVFCVNDGGLR
jgi:hypothetical protein